ncbi:MAG: ThiF family adenylyltransferase [Clostridia bacterium]
MLQKKRVYDINKNIDITSINEVITKDNISNIITDELDYVVDAVDNMEAKIAIITECDKKKIKCISCMGVGNKLNPLDIKVDDIYNTCVCPLAKRVRKQLKSIGIKNLKVIYSIESPKINCENNAIGSVSFVPSVAGLVIASEIVKDFMFKN